MVVVLYLFRY